MESDNYQIQKLCWCRNFCFIVCVKWRMGIFWKSASVKLAYKRIRLDHGIGVISFWSCPEKNEPNPYLWTFYFRFHSTRTVIWFCFFFDGTSLKIPFEIAPLWKLKKVLENILRNFWVCNFRKRFDPIVRLLS